VNKVILGPVALGIGFRESPAEAPRYDWLVRAVYSL
jgi:hypothetical protein